MLSVLMFVLLSSCGESPLFNHELEENFNVGSGSVFSQNAEFKFAKTGYSFAVDWTEAPHIGQSSFQLKIWKTQVGTINGPFEDPSEQLHVFLWMPSMGHGSSPVTLTKIAPGEYDVTNVYFIMGGKWQVKFQLISNGKVVDETVLNYTI
jgi:hypothetical protein